MSLPTKEAVESIIQGFRSRMSEWDDAAFQVLILTDEEDWYHISSGSLNQGILAARSILVDVRESLDSDQHLEWSEEQRQRWAVWNAMVSCAESTLADVIAQINGECTYVEDD